MNNSGARPSASAVRLAGFAPEVVSVKAQAVVWPEPIGSGRPRAPAVRLAPQAPYRPASLAPAQPEVPAPREPVGQMPRLPKGTIEHWPMRLDAHPEDYARLWFSNLFRTLLTLGLYLPWARVRSQRFFLKRTRVANEPMDYHEPASHLLPRYGLCLALVMGVAGAWSGSTLSGMLALSLALAVWPLLVFLSLTHRMAHISWGRRRLAFDGLCQDVYQAMWAPLAGGGVVAWLLMAAALWHEPEGWLAWGAALGLWLLCMPAFVWTWFHFRQHRLRLGSLGMMWKAQRSAVFMLCVRTLVWVMLTTVLTLGVAAVAVACALSSAGRLSVSFQQGVLMAGVLMVCAAVMPYVQARLQNLVWSKTGNRYLRFRSKLPVAAYVAMQCRHALLLVLTLGLYWPWAVVATRRMRTQAITVWSRVDAEVFKANWPTHKATVTGKMAGSPARTRRTI